VESHAAYATRSETTTHRESAIAGIAGFAKAPVQAELTGTIVAASGEQCKTRTRSATDTDPSCCRPWLETSDCEISSSCCRSLTGWMKLNGVWSATSSSQAGEPDPAISL
jgi:hypothetical protein